MEGKKAEKGETDEDGWFIHEYAVDIVRNEVDRQRIKEQKKQRAMKDSEHACPSGAPGTIRISRRPPSGAKRRARGRGDSE